MAKRKAEKEAKVLTLEEKKIKARASFSNILNCSNSFGAPTYTFNIGDNVKVGNLQNCVIDDIDMNGDLQIYGFTYTDKDNEECYQYTPWYNVRPYSLGTGNTSFTDEDKVDIRFFNSTIDSLLSKYYLHGINMAPDYQRDYVWEDSDKEALLDSIFSHIEIGKFAFIRHDYSDDCGFEILDGKQRLSTLLDFYENRLAYKGVYYNDLSPKDRYTFLNTPITMGETSELTKEQIYKYFYVLNRSGKVMDESHLEKIKNIIKVM